MDENLKRQLENLKADIEDAPDRVRQRKSNLVVIGLVVAICSISTAWYLIDSRKIESEIKERPVMGTLDQGQETERELQEETPEDIFWQSVEESDQGQAAERQRQTVFNETNYRPRTNINTIPAPVPRIAATRERTRQETTERGLNGTKRIVKMPWRDARGRRSNWSTSFTYQNSIINNGSFCKNYRYGSIEYRTCRKAAKDWLRNRCQSNSQNMNDAWRGMYCSAESRFRP